jgi:hypothetical protein
VGGRESGQAGAGCEAGRQVGIRQAGRQPWALGRQVGMKGGRKEEKDGKETKSNSKQIDLSTFACFCPSSICIKDGKST